MFKGAQLKIKRADKHIDDLNAFFNAIIRSDDFQRMRFADQGCPIGMNIARTNTVAGDVALILGDAVHNLRSALDLMYCEIVEFCNIIPGKHSSFPTRTGPNGRNQLIGDITTGEIKTAGADIISAIVDVIQPYTGGKGAALCALHTLDILDKHKLLIPTVTFTGVIGTISEVARVNLSRTIGDIFGEAEGIAGENEPNNGQSVFAVLFADGQPFEKQAVIPTLHKLSILVSGTVQVVENAYLARN